MTLVRICSFRLTCSETYGRDQERRPGGGGGGGDGHLSRLSPREDVGHIRNKRHKIPPYSPYPNVSLSPVGPSPPQPPPPPSGLRRLTSVDGHFDDIPVRDVGQQWQQQPYQHHTSRPQAKITVRPSYHASATSTSREDSYRRPRYVTSESQLLIHRLMPEGVTVKQEDGPSLLVREPTSPQPPRPAVYQQGPEPPALRPPLMRSVGDHGTQFYQQQDVQGTMPTRIILNNPGNAGKSKL